jgi:hypothetical protein
MSFSNRVKADFREELTIDASTFTGANQSIGSFAEPPSMVIIQNDTDVTVSVRRFSNSSQTGISFVAGTKLVLDMTTNRALAEFFSFPANTPILVNAAAGTGLFKIAFIYGTA